VAKRAYFSVVVELNYFKLKKEDGKGEEKKKRKGKEEKSKARFTNRGATL
jgi:hypothetical protein